MMAQTLQLFIIVQSVLTVKSMIYAPFFNAALNRPMILEPESSICGLNEPTTYCQSSETQQSTLSCAQETCDMSCPYRSALPKDERISAFDRVVSSFKYGECVRLNASFLAPYPLAKQSKQFLGNPDEGSCYMDLDPNWFATFILMGRMWELTFGVWVYHADKSGISTIVDFASAEAPTLRLFIALDTIGVQSGELVVTHKDWLIPPEQWTHVGLQVYENSITLFLNGTAVVPSFYNLNLAIPGHTTRHRVGNNQDGNQAFVGMLDEMLIFTTLLTNREIRLMYNTEFTELRVMSECRCPPSHPAIKSENELYCAQNEGEGQLKTEAYRIHRGQSESYPLEFLNDGDIRTPWLSQPGEEENSITIDLGDVYEVHSIHVTLYSPYPALITLEHKTYKNDTWELWHYFSQDCLTETGYQPEGMLTYEEDVICTHFYDPDLKVDEIHYSSETVSLNLLDGRPGIVDDGSTERLKKFLLSSSIRVTMRGHPLVLDPQHMYHGIYDINVNATCNCNGKGEICDRTTSPYTCSCAEETYATGDQCELCAPGAYFITGGSVDGVCEPCGCSQNGTNSTDVSCSEDGQCSCKMYATGMKCDTCIENFYNLDMENPDGCETCKCNTTGTVNGSNLCDPVTGQCPCKTNVGGLLCDECLPGFYSRNFSSEEGCEYCSCNMAGTVSSKMECDLVTGDCNCKETVTGKTCDTCAASFFNLTSTNPEGCESCLCDAKGALNSSCDSQSGQCYCKPNVIGLKCSECDVGYYALDDDDFANNGCQHECACSPVGSEVNQTGCVGLGGQCQCKTHVDGRACDSCKLGFFNLSLNNNEGCLSCECHEPGTNGSLKCDSQTGQCVCKENVAGRRCDECSRGFYGLSMYRELGCAACECSILGASDSSDCSSNDGQCNCLGDHGDVTHGGRQCMPYFQNFSPNYGPRSGGTKLAINVGYVGPTENITIRIGSIPCDLVESAPTSLACITHLLTETELLDQKQDIEITLSDGSILLAPDFTYKKDPVVSNISPLHTILSGGIILTVKGDNLNSVATPKFVIYAKYGDGSGQIHEDSFESNCTAEHEDEMKCPTPSIEIREDLLDSENANLRRKRSADEQRLNSDNLEFQMGFIMDGVTLYRDLTSNTDFGTLSVYRNPVFHKFKEERHIKYFRTYWPYKDKRVAVMGERMNYGASESDYHVIIGGERASDIELHQNRLGFSPPQVEPDIPGTLYGNTVDVLIAVGNYEFLAGHLRYEANFWANMTFRYGVIGGICGLFLLILLCICISCCRKNNERKKAKAERVRRATKMMDNSFDEFTLEATLKRPGNPYSDGFDPKGTQSSGGYLRPDVLMKPSGTLNPSYSVQLGLMDQLPPDLQTTVKYCLLDEDLLILGAMVGEGHFGRVYSGKLTDGHHPYKENVAVKTLREYNVNIRDMTQFLEEATLMANFQHDHVLSLTGVVIRNNHPYVVLPLMENGDLRSFISTDENMLTVGELIHFGMQIADGMNYLAEKRFVHRDLACRNCMINRDFIVKVADFGLSRDIYANDYYRVSNTKRPLPVKWMAVESLENGTFDTRSDVWSFGVVMWELLTRGCHPYPDVDNFDMRSYILCGNRMDRPDYAPDEMYSMMLDCWAENPAARPTFRKIYNRIAVFLDESSTKTIMRSKQGQQVPSIAYRGRSYIDVSNENRLSFNYNQFDTNTYQY